jgi:polysaccharide pyruvyl transferase CsaB
LDNAPRESHAGSSNRSERLKIAALGYYGFANLGDEAVLAGIRRALASQPATGNAEFLVLSNDTAATARLHPGVSAANRWQWREASNALKNTDLFILGGGSLLQDATSARSVIWYTLMAMLARRLSRKVLWWGQGIGPLNSKLSRFLVRLTANQADALTVRDDFSAQLLKGIGAKGSIEIVADPAFALEPDISPHSSPPTVLLSLRAWKTDELGKVLSEQASVEKFLGKSPLSVPMHLPEDVEYTRRTLKGVVPQFDWRECGATVEQTLAIFGQAELVIAMRLHALIFAACCAVPFVALSYDPKVDALAKAAGQEDVLVPVNEITMTMLEDAVRRVQATADARRTTLRAFAEQQRQRAYRPAQLASEIL